MAVIRIALIASGLASAVSAPAQDQKSPADWLESALNSAPVVKTCEDGSVVLASKRCGSQTSEPVSHTPCQTSFEIFFEPDSAELTEGASALLEAMARAYQGCSAPQVMIVGLTDTKGSSDYNIALSGRMAAKVRSYLESHGVPGGLMTTKALGESRLAVRTADGVSMPKNRRVVVTFGKQPSGWLLD